MSEPYLYGRGGKWSALIGSWVEFRARHVQLYDSPVPLHIDAEIARLKALRWEWVEEQRKALKRVERARRAA